jgi:hypothetical protein
VPSSARVAARGTALVATEIARAGYSRARASGGDVPLRSSGLTPRWLEGAMGLPAGAIASVSVVDEHSGTAGRARLALQAGGDVDVPSHVFVKLTPTSYFQHVLMLLFGLGEREVLVYRSIAPDLPVRVPRCYATVIDARRGRNAIVLEDLADTARFRDIREPASASETEAVVDAMARQHAAFWQTGRLQGDLRPLTGRAAAANLLGDVIRKRFLGSMKGLGADMVPKEMQGQCSIFFERSAGIDAMWASQPQTVLHGDPHLGNLFFEGATPGFLDWQIAMAGAGIRDVAYFAVQSVDADLLRTIERGLVDRYASGLEAAGITVDPERLWTLYRAGVTEAFLASVTTAEAGERMQNEEVCRAGISRAVAGVEAHDSFTVLARLVDGAEA